MLAALAAAGCGDEPATGDVLVLDPDPACAAPSGACLNAGVEALEVAGVRVIHKRVPHQPFVAVRIAFDDIDRSAAQHWAEAFALALFERSGSRDLDGVEWPALWRNLGATLSVTPAGRDYVSISFEAPRTEWLAAWELLTDALVAPNTNPYELDNVRNNYRTGFASERDAPDDAAAIDAFGRLFRGDAYNRSRESQDALDSLSPPRLQDAWASLRVRGRWLVTVVGDVDAEQATTALSSLLSRLPDPGDIDVFGSAAAVSVEQPGAAVLLDYPDSPTWHVVSYFRGPRADSADLMPLRLGMSVLDRRLFHEVRDEQGLAYVIDASASQTRQTFGTLSFSSTRPQDALLIMQRIILDLKTAGPLEHELGAARALERTARLSSNVRPSGQAAALSHWELVGGGRQRADALLEELDTISAESVRVALGTYLTAAQSAAAGPDDSLDAFDWTALFDEPSRQPPP
jgi:predicted Zn-dependent peptidase